jgi:hypothetical protein
VNRGRHRSESRSSSSVRAWGEALFSFTKLSAAMALALAAVVPAMTHSVGAEWSQHHEDDDPWSWGEENDLTQALRADLHRRYEKLVPEHLSARIFHGEALQSRFQSLLER